jgi:hypothetical protein
MPSVIKRVWAFTPVGFAAVVIALAILVQSLYARNAYEIVLVAAVLGVCLALGIVGAWGARHLAGLEPGWKPPSPLTASAPAVYEAGARGKTRMQEDRGKDAFPEASKPEGRINADNAGSGAKHLITGLDVRVPWFFRLHFVVKGRFYPVGASYGCPVRAETSAPSVRRNAAANTASGAAAEGARLDLSFPLSGVFHGEGSCRLRDIFGFFSFPCALPQHRVLMVRSAPCPEKAVRIEAHSGAEDRRNKTSSNEERYYMREYAPGDRFRDINWKSSERINTLITRISPDNQEKVSRIEVYFRNYGPVGSTNHTDGFRRSPSLEALWLLDRSKARLARFLRTVREEQAAYVIHLNAAQGSWDIEDEAGLEAFLDELAGLPFSPPRNDATGTGTGPLYVFSTACDTGLPAFLLTRQAVSLFLTRPADAGKGIPADGIERLSVRDFAAKGFVPSLRWLDPRKDRAIPLSVNGAITNGKVEIDYAEARL